MKLSLRSLRYLTFLLVLMVQLGSYASSDSFLQIDKKAQKKWQYLINLQEDLDWVTNQTEMGLYGPIFQKGWTNPRVDRKVVPDRDNGFLVVDSVTMGAKTLTQLTTLSSNLLLSMYFPYVQGGPIREKIFSNVRKVKTYKEAIEKKHFKLATIPQNSEDFKYVENGEVFTTISTSGFFSRYSIMMLDMLEVAIPGPMEFGPKAKLHIQKSLKITIGKENNNTAIISIENTKEKGLGIGTGLGIFFEGMIDLPVTIGINGQNGYSPLVFNYKKNKRNISHLVYKIKLDSPLGEKAYQSFLNSDFTLLQDLADKKESPVELAIKKDGVIKTKERSFGLNLILWRSGFRNIHIDGKFKTTLADGSTYRYSEEQITKMKDRSGFSGKEKEFLQFSTMIPTDKDNYSGFVLDTTFYYQDTKTRGSELEKISRKLKSLGFPKGIPVKFNKKKKYGETQIQTNIRFSASAIKTILSADEELIWEAIATTLGHSDPFIWLDQESRELYEKRNENDRGLLNAKKVYNIFVKIDAASTVQEKAKVLLKSLKRNKVGPLLHSTMISIVGIGEIMGSGYIRGI